MCRVLKIALLTQFVAMALSSGIRQLGRGCCYKVLTVGLMDLSMSSCLRLSVWPSRFHSLFERRISISFNASPVVRGQQTAAKLHHPTAPPPTDRPRPFLGGLYICSRAIIYENFISTAGSQKCWNGSNSRPICRV